MLPPCSLFVSKFSPAGGKCQSSSWTLASHCVPGHRLLIFSMLSSPSCSVCTAILRFLSEPCNHLSLVPCLSPDCDVLFPHLPSHSFKEMDPDLDLNAPIPTVEVVHCLLFSLLSMQDKWKLLPAFLQVQMYFFYDSLIVPDERTGQAAHRQLQLLRRCRHQEDREGLPSCCESRILMH